METYNLNHPIMLTGKLGCMRCMFARDLAPGEVLSVTPNVLVTGAQLRQPSMIPFQILTFSAFVPMRWVYGNEVYTAFIRGGMEETTTFPGDALSDGHTYSSLGVIGQSGTIPKWYRDCVYRIHRHHVRFPKDTSLDTFDEYKTHFWEDSTYGADYREFGLPIPWPEDVKFRGWWDDFEADAGKVAVTASKVDLLDIRKQIQDYRREAEQILGEEFLNDILENRFGTSVTREVDQQPVLIGDFSDWMSNYSVEPTDTAGIGQIQGRFSGQLGRGSGFTFKAREHGYVMLFVAVRPTFIHKDERHPVLNKVDPTYLEAARDPQFMALDRPQEYLESDYYRSTGSDVLAVQPAHQHNRWHPALVDPAFPNRLVYPFVNRIPAMKDRRYFIRPDDYSHIFSSDVLNQYNMQGYMDVEFSSLTPSGMLAPGQSLS